MKRFAMTILGSVPAVTSVLVAATSQASAAECEIGGPALAPASCEVTCDQNGATVFELGVGIGICLAHPDGGCEVQCGPYLGGGVSCVAHAEQQLVGTRSCYVFPIEQTAEQGVIIQARCRC